MPEERSTGTAHHHVGAALQRHGRGEAEFEDPVHLLERVREEQVEERDAGTLGDPLDLLDEMGQRSAGRIQVGLEDRFQRACPSPCRSRYLRLNATDRPVASANASPICAPRSEGLPWVVTNRMGTIFPRGAAEGEPG